MTVFERDPKPGGAFRLAGLAPLFQEVEANPRAFERYIAQLVAACEHKGVTFHFATDVTAQPDMLAPFERIVVATGARYRFGLGQLPSFMLERGMAHWPGFKQLFSSDRFRDWFYYRARASTAGAIAALARPGQVVTIIGDAIRPGKSKDAIASAFEAALMPYGDASADK